MKTQFSHLVKARRLHMRRTQKFISRKAGVSEHWIQNVECGAVFSLFVRLDGLAHALDMSVMQILEAAWFDATGTLLRGKGVKKFIPNHKEK